MWHSNCLNKIHLNPQPNQATFGGPTAIAISSSPYDVCVLWSLSKRILYSLLTSPCHYLGLDQFSSIHNNLPLLQDHRQKHHLARQKSEGDTFASLRTVWGRCHWKSFFIAQIHVDLAARKHRILPPCTFMTSIRRFKVTYKESLE